MSNIEFDLTTFNKLAALLLEDEKANPVAEVIPADKLFQKLDISLKEEAIDEEAFFNSIKDIVLATPKTASNLFFNQLFGGRQSKAVLGDLLAVMLNNSMYTYKVAGPQVGIEKEIIRKSCDLINFGEGSGGTFATGGSMSNYMAMIMARDAYDHEIRSEGMQRRLIAYTSEESHYSIAKNASFAGIGRNNIRYIESDDHGKISIDDLIMQIEKDLAAGNAPFFINATAGTTVLGAFDSIKDLADIAEKYKIWLHVDGAYCGSVIFSNRFRHLVKGLERADSFSYNAHKMLGTPLTCSLILVKNHQHLYDSFSNDATYLYQTDSDDYNLGKTSFQCGRRNDALKFWTLWKSIGTNGLAKLVEHQFHLADIARQYVRDHPDYTLYSFEDSISICFNYKNIPAAELCKALYENQEAVVGFGTFQGQEFVRLVTVNANNSAADILKFFEVLEAFAEKKEAEFASGSYFE